MIPTSTSTTDSLVVFVASRMGELADARGVVRQALQDMYIRAFLYDHDAPANETSVSRTMLTHVERADVFLALFSSQYSPGTVQEFHHARKLGKPCLVYLRKGSVRDAELDRFLIQYVLDVETGVANAYWEIATDLAEKVGRDIMSLLVEKYRKCSRKLPVTSLAPAVRLAVDVEDWFRVMGHQTVCEPMFENEHTVNLQMKWKHDDPYEGVVFKEQLIRCRSGRVMAQDVVAFRHAVVVSGAGRGLMVSDLEITPAARDEVRRGEPLLLRTFDELIEEKVRFDEYLEWLEREVQRQRVEMDYLTLGCSSEETQTDSEQAPRVANYPVEMGGIDRYVELWLLDSRKEHLSILGGFGTGKTWFLLHLGLMCARHYKKAKQLGLPRPRIPLIIPLRDFAKAVEIESLLLKFFFSRHHVGLPSLETFHQLNRMGKLLLLFDGFDEMASQIDRHKMIQNFWEFASVLAPGSKAIITCRTEHFPDAKAGRSLLSGNAKAATAELSGQSPQFEVVELQMFTDEQVRQVLLRRAGPAITEQILEREELRDLAHRPLMVGLILDALRDIKGGAPVDLARIYLYAVRRKIEEDIKNERTFTSAADKLFFLSEISWEMLAHGQTSLNYRQIPERIRRIFKDIVREQKDLDHWEYDLRGNSMLIRKEDGDYSPAHRSLIEFFVAFKLVAEMGMLAADFTQLAQQQSHVDQVLPPKPYRWSEYFRREMEPDGTVKRISPLSHFVTEDYEHSSQEAGVDAQVFADKVSKNVLLIAAGMVASDPSCLDALCEMAWQTTGRLAWNALSLLPFLKYQHAAPLAELLVCKSRGKPLRSGVAWVLGELGVASEQVCNGLRLTIHSLKQGTGASASAWWECAFALEKLGALGPRQGHQGAEAIQQLESNLPMDITSEVALESLRANLEACEPVQARINPCHIVAVAASRERAVRERFIKEVLPMVDFAADTLGRRAYYMSWLCGHLKAKESVTRLLQACRHPLSSVRNCASEALGKVGCSSLEVIECLETALRDDYYRTRFHAAWSLGEIGSVESLPSLVTAIRAEEVLDVRKEMVRVKVALQNTDGLGP